MGTQSYIIGQRPRVAFTVGKNNWFFLEGRLFLTAEQIAYEISQQDLTYKFDDPEDLWRFSRYLLWLGPPFKVVTENTCPCKYRGYIIDASAYDATGYHGRVLGNQLAGFYNDCDNRYNQGFWSSSEDDEDN